MLERDHAVLGIILRCERIADVAGRIAIWRQQPALVHVDPHKGGGARVEGLIDANEPIVFVLDGST